MKRLIAVSIVLSGPLIVLLAAGCGGGASGVEWHLREFADHGVTVNIPAGWNVNRTGVFQATSEDHMASVDMRPARIPRGSDASTAAEHLEYKIESFEKFEINQPLARLDHGQMEIAGTTGEWVELSYRDPATWLRVISFIADKPYIITCWARKKDAIPQAEERRKFSFEAYRSQLIEIVKSVRCNQTIGE